MSFSFFHLEEIRALSVTTPCKPSIWSTSLSKVATRLFIHPGFSSEESVFVVVKVFFGVGKDSFVEGAQTDKSSYNLTVQ